MDSSRDQVTKIDVPVVQPRFNLAINGSLCGLNLRCT